VVVDSASLLWLVASVFHHGQSQARASFALCFVDADDRSVIVAAYL
jgi:hypothetical protein